jgi:hypothetical protein
MEWLLSNMWRSQAISARELRKLTGNYQANLGPLKYKKNDVFVSRNRATLSRVVGFNLRNDSVHAANAVLLAL